MFKIEFSNVNFKEEFGANACTIKLQVGVYGFRDGNAFDLKCIGRKTEKKKEETEKIFIHGSRTCFHLV